MAVNNQNSTTPENEKDLGQTPFWFIRSVESFVGKKINLDVCCLSKTSKAPDFFSLEYGLDCMVQNWTLKDKDVFAWCNPPFSNVDPFIDRAVNQAMKSGTTTAMIIPNNPEVAYRRKLKSACDTFIEMPFRLKFLRPDGTPFVSEKTNKEQSPKFSCALAIITPMGLKVPSRIIEHDFRTDFYKVGGK